MVIQVYDAETSSQVGSPATIAVGYASLRDDFPADMLLLFLETALNPNGNNVGAQIELAAVWDRALSAVEVASLSRKGSASVTSDWLASPLESNQATDAWQFFHQIDTANRSGSYTLLPFYDDTDADGPGDNGSDTGGFLDQALLEVWTEADDVWDLAGKNISPTETIVVDGDIFVRPNLVVLHPATGAISGVSVSFLVPLSEVYFFSLSVENIDQNGGLGVNWFFDLESAEYTGP